MHEAAFRSVKRACYAGLDSITLRTEVARRASAAVGFDAHGFSTVDPETGLMTHTVGENVPELLARGYLSLLYPYECAPLTSYLARAGKVVFSMADVSAPFGSFLQSSELDHEVNVLMALDGALWGSWCILRGSGSPAMPASERNFLRRIAPHVARGLRNAALLDCAHEPPDEADESAPPGVIVLDERGRPLLRTAPAVPILEDLADVGLSVSDSVPCSVAAAVSAVRQRHIQNAADAPAEVTLRVRGRSGRWYVIRGSLAEPDAEGRSSAVVIVRPIAPREMAPILARLYGLSDREREITAAVARGESTKRIALRLGISPYTVQEHLDRACEKIGVRGRKALVAKLFFDGYAPRIMAAGA
ncbi:MAG TPA: LuxR C-terminal-related transcriptional regulator [Longimicrobiaceae bacterium]|nr:LuxR C-terminal-related transcriptional regulator [Longimicrobiaceae bacterium]